MSKNNFIKDASFYKRTINPVADYIKQTSFYLHKMTNRPIEDCVNKVKESLQHMVDPNVKHFRRDETGDKLPDDVSLLEYINDTVTNNEILVPTFTTYKHPTVYSSKLVKYTDHLKKHRSVLKKEAFKLSHDKLAIPYIIKNNGQLNAKRKGNSVSGTFASDGSVLKNPTGHNTLTSIIRSITSVSNASNEKIIEGNRHYYNVDITLNNLIALTVDLDQAALDTVMVKYNLHYPSINDTIDCIKRSTDLYWINDLNNDSLKRIIDFINVLNPTERAAIVYISDLFHIRKHNESFVRNLLTTLSKKIVGRHYEDPIKEIYSIDELIINYVHQIFIYELKGKKYNELDHQVLCSIVDTGLNIESTINDYKDFIECFFVTNNVPASTAYIQSMVRRTVTISDTDSSMFSVDSWVYWYFNELKFDAESFALAGSVMFIATQAMAHNLAMFSANMNVEPSKLFNLQMKPEFVFPVLAQTPVAKHYFTFSIMQEGNAFEEPQMEIKGVYLKDSSLPRDLIKDSQDTMKNILMTIYEGGKIELVTLLHKLYDKELMILRELQNNNTAFYKKSKIKEPSSYVNEPEQSPYMHHLLWKDIFEVKYYPFDEPPYTVIKIPTIVSNITGVKKWIDQIQDKDLAKRLAHWFSKKNKRDLNTIYLSEDYVLSFGIPDEIKLVIDYKEIILQLTGSDRMVIDTLGMCLKENFLVSEIYEFN